MGENQEHYQSHQSQGMVRKFIIDTDTGVDDAMALLMALDAHLKGEIEIVAITAVNGNTEESNAKINILRTLDSAGCGEIPVYCGAEEALVVPYINTDRYHGQDGFNDVSFDETPDLQRVREERAWRVFSRVCQAHPGTVTLVALGPLTNVAIGMLADPELCRRLEHLYIMGGNCEGIGNVTSSAEFNFHADPEAASTVLRLAQCPVTIATWEL